MITGGDSGNGRAVALHFAREGADCALVYLDEETDARGETAGLVEGERAPLRADPRRSDVGDPAFARRSVDRTLSELGGPGCILVHNAAEQYGWKEITELEKLTSWSALCSAPTCSATSISPGGAAACEGRATASSPPLRVNAFQGNPTLLDYTATKGAVQALMRSFLDGADGSGHPRQRGGAEGRILDALDSGQL